MSDFICLFATHATRGRLPPHTAYYLSELKSCGFVIHLALSGAMELAPDIADFCEKNDVTPWVRPNLGHDFGAWKDLVLSGCAGNASRVLLANDSVFGPFVPLAPIFSRMERTGCDVWGMIESLAVIPHLQSWFVCFECGSFHAGAVERVLLQDFSSMTREELIWHGELGLSVAFRAAGLSSAAVWSEADSLPGRMAKMNAMHSHWHQLLRSGRVPFVKTELVRDNPFHLSTVERWRENLPPGSAFRPEWIADYLKENPARSGRTQANWKGRLIYNLVNRFSHIP